MKKFNLTHVIAIAFISMVLASCSSSLQIPGLSSSASQPVQDLNSTNTWNGNVYGTWEQLQQMSSARLTQMLSTTTDPANSAWIQLALISKQHSTQTNELINNLLVWREHNPSHPANVLFPNNQTLNQLASASKPLRIALLLPLHGAYGSAGKTVREGFLNAYYAHLANTNHQSTMFYDTSQSSSIGALYQQALAEGADFIVGPLEKNHVQQLTQMTLNVPTLALNYTEIGFRSLPSNLYEFGLLPEDEAGQMAKRARHAGLSRAIIIAPRNTWGTRLVSAFSTQWENASGKIQDSWYYTSSADFNQEIAHLLNVDPRADKKLMKKNNSKTILQQQRRQDFDVIFLFSQPREGNLIVPLLRYYYADNIPIYATSHIHSGKPNPTKDVDLNGVIVCDLPWSIQMAKHPTNDAVQSDRLYAVGQDAYLLSQQLQRLIQLPNFPLYGTTGALVYTSDHQIHRRLPCAVIHNGLL